MSSIGQPDAGTGTGGIYTVVGGFWSIVHAVQTPGAPFLSITRHAANGMVTVQWPLPANGFVLDRAPMLSGNSSNGWSQAAFPYQTNATHIFVTVPPSDPARFYRLRKP